MLGCRKNNVISRYKLWTSPSGAKRANTYTNCTCSRNGTLNEVVNTVSRTGDSSTRGILICDNYIQRGETQSASYAQRTKW